MCFLSQSLGTTSAYFIHQSPVYNYIKKFGIKDIHYRDNFILYKLLDNESCLKAAYNQIQDKLNVMEDELREKILNYPIPKQIIEEYNKVMN